MGLLVATSSVSDVFGVELGIPPSLPNFKKNNSFQYSSTTVDGPVILKQGPTSKPLLHPLDSWGWVYRRNVSIWKLPRVGDSGGIISGLRGHVGSLKFYSRPLDNVEVLTNYKAQKGFFKNIKI